MTTSLPRRSFAFSTRPISSRWVTAAINTSWSIGPYNSEEEIMRYRLILVIGLGLCGTAAADTIKATVNGMVCGFCATGIEKTFKAQQEVKAVNVDLQNKLVTIQTKEGQTIDDAKLRKLIGNAGYSVVAIVRGK